MTVKEKKRILQRYGRIDDQINMLCDEKDRWHSKLVNPGQAIHDRVSGGGNGICPAQAMTERLEEIDRVINSEVLRLCNLRKRIVVAIVALPDLNERKVLYWKYIGKKDHEHVERLSLWRIAREMNYSVDRVNHIHGSAIVNLEL